MSIFSNMMKQLVNLLYKKSDPITDIEKYCQLQTSVYCLI